MLENLLTPVECTEKVIVLKVKDNLTNLEIARHPILQSNYDYISIIRGGNVVVCVTTKNGEVINFTSGPFYAYFVNELEGVCDSYNLFMRKHSDTIISGICFYHQNGPLFRCSLTLEDGSTTDIYDKENIFPDLESFANHIAKKYGLKAIYEYNNEYYYPNTYRMEVL